MIAKDVDYTSAVELIDELLKTEKLSADQRHYLINMRSGIQAEKHTAYCLDVHFAHANDIFVLNNLKVIHGDHITQVDHLVLSRKGMYFIESKSVADRIEVNEYEEWFRIYGDTHIPIKSPVEQVNQQVIKVCQLMQDNLIEFRRQFLGLQGQIGCYPIHHFVAVSEKGTITGSGRKMFKDCVMKYEFVPKRIKRLERRSLWDIITLETKNFFNKNELTLLVEFLLNCDASCEHVTAIREWAYTHIYNHDQQELAQDSTS